MTNNKSRKKEKTLEEQFFTDEELEKLKNLPPLPPKEEELLYQLAGMLVDRVLEMTPEERKELDKKIKLHEAGLDGCKKQK